ncbi:hypothetical protein G3M48_008975 [Beauveria asiatica]|uniref:Uncharacterized protein n=1 Tax=Beauveria asiatica TaxID=1069075 RepID=A0AAW0RJW3_9HYPO
MGLSRSLDQLQQHKYLRVQQLYQQDQKRQGDCYDLEGRNQDQGLQIRDLRR